MRETCCLHSFFLLAGVKHLNPRQGITTRRRRRHGRHDRAGCVKHLNPRQGITTCGVAWALLVSLLTSVKHLHPRQGITISIQPTKVTSASAARCETPKSPPGDYNVQGGATDRHRNRRACETPKSPPGDYNEKRSRTDLRRRVRLV